MGLFDGKVVIITGAARGQGRSHAINFAGEGANMAISDIGKNAKLSQYNLGTTEELEDTANECRKLGSRVVSVICDITSDSQVKSMVDACIKEFGRVDIVVNNAAWTRMSPLHELSEEDIVAQIDTTLIGAIRVSKHVIPHMIKQKDGCIINIASTGIRGFPNFIPYGCAKNGILGLTKGLALELAPYNIRANTVIPGIVDTGMVRGLAPVMGMNPDEAVKTFAESTNLIPDVVIQPQSISKAIMYLASDPVLTGAELAVDAGHLLK